VTPVASWPQFDYSFTEDAAIFLDEAEMKRAKEVFDQ